MGPLSVAPIGMQLAWTHKVLRRAFDEALDEVGGSVPMWSILVSLKVGRHGMQRALADAVGIEGPTLTHHLNRMEKAGLITRRRDPENRRIHVVALTDAGEIAFHRLRRTVTAVDRRLRAGFGDEEITALSGMLERLRENVAGSKAMRATS